MEERPMTMRTIAIVLLMASSLACGSDNNTATCTAGQILVAGKCTAISADAGGGDPLISLPLTVDTYFGPGGYMGDGAMPGGITAGACPQRAGEMKGMCHRFTWMPGALMWAGVYWQNPPLFWGDKPDMGLRVASGAKQVTFWAWGAQGGERVSFAAGYGDMSTDGFKRTLDNVVLTTTPTMRIIDLTGITYARVGGGFAWTSADSTTPVTFMVDDIQWR
jgi:hypothetical protein